MSPKFFSNFYHRFLLILFFPWRKSTSFFLNDVIVLLGILKTVETTKRLLNGKIIWQVFSEFFLKIWTLIFSYSIFTSMKHKGLLFKRCGSAVRNFKNRKDHQKIAQWQNNLTSCLRIFSKNQIIVFLLFFLFPGENQNVAVL